MNNAEYLKLSNIGEDKKVLIKDIKDVQLKTFFAQLGIFVGQEVYVSKIAPFGSPIALNTVGIEIAVRKEDAEMVEVELV